VWAPRYDQINAFEKYLTENNIHLLKFFLHISKRNKPSACNPASIIHTSNGSLRPPTSPCARSWKEFMPLWNTKRSSVWKNETQTVEDHVQLKTKSKMWCGCANQFGSEPNTNVCPVCLGMPGVLPVPNEEALRLTVLTGYLLNCEIPRFAKFDRKSYFYPDMPKNYQLTQYDKPSTANGFVEFELNGGSNNVPRAHHPRAPRRRRRQEHAL
jgi:hypothetical protein